MKALLFMDVDGALIPYGDHPRPGFQPARLWGFDVQIPDGVIARAQELCDRLDWVWATTWEPEGVRQIEQHLGLPELPQLAARTQPAKLGEIIRWTSDTPDRPVVWVDDRIGGRGLRTFPRGRPGPVLYLSTDRDVGLTGEHIDQILQFAGA